MAEEDQRAAREADVAGGDRREPERGEGSNDSRHEQMDSCICSEGIRFLALHAAAPSRGAAKRPAQAATLCGLARGDRLLGRVDSYWPIASCFGSSMEASRSSADRSSP